MVDPRKRQTGKKQQSITSRNSVSVEMWRFYLMWGVVLLCFIALIGRAFYVQIVNHDFLQNKANAKILRTESIKAMRGVIYDRHGVPLAISTPVMKVVIDPRDYFEAKKLYEDISAELIKDPTNRKLKRQLPDSNLNLDELADAVGMDRAELRKKMNERSRSRYLVLKKEVPPQQADVILKREFQGVYTEKNYKRYYPQPQPNAQIIGLTNSEGMGIEGLEMQLNTRLAGVDGEQQVIRDKRGNRVKDPEIIKEVEAGENITLSIDSRLQYIMYRELTASGVANNARSATAITVDVKTGEILAMASWPSYNPNDKNGLNNKDAMRNRGAVDSFEPGSTMKPLTVAMALESGKFTTNSVINTAPGTMRVGNHTIRDTHDYGSLTLGGIIQKSSNVGVAKIALSLPYSTLPTFYKRVGFGERSAVKFPGESAGLILPKNKWNVSEVATMAYGYSLNATVLQLADAYAMIANKGKKMPLSLYKLEELPKGEQMIDPKIADQVLLMMEAVTLPGGTARQADIPGYRVAGKTGTAHKLRADRKGYSQSDYRALFAGVAPVSDPRLAMIVVVENPKGQYYGGLVAAPVFARVMQESLRLMNVPLDKPLDAPKVQ
ncbi:penicillin-binding protein PBP3 [Acinetobacter faecalis]|uniref:penicillin-binding protein PBP3 n=1 Tax=Acinetobacter faecalis TaxID=2665161 RepID=UPI002A920B96|nr:penicillin-binding protein PBP3 [Acinetobacter faecalis]MDY6449423.1 penicillin-binding protein PBP3 [Acinetobacter faecalis]MDY6456224.1 penicillin-binding protein PBP3 [Acinetobacter faecalis]MDY6459255.1 penicillin-binding protein PBP3 [Acinetobacter faecalis]MDY6461815.1 penicillin-binding protein PBP3 [Acinetobacter faecalis]MDY6468018.1 penicillin-binding protein PBP3 [Acinetobacter faecalis]